MIEVEHLFLRVCIKIEVVLLKGFARVDCLSGFAAEVGSLPLLEWCSENYFLVRSR